MALIKLRELLGRLDQVISREARKGTFNDYPEREYSQAAGSAEHRLGEDIV